VDPGGFLVEKVLEQNDHARVYLARKPGGAVCVLKELLFSAVPTAQALEAFERECSLLEAIDYPQIPRFLGRFREGTGVDVRLYLVQEYIAGDSLQDRVRRRLLTETEALVLGRSVLATLVFLHGQRPKIVHRDVKPANLITDAAGVVHLVDFGAARLLERKETHQGTVVGTFGYMPLEQFGGTLDETADLHALGATLVFALTGQDPATFLTPEMVLELPQDLRVSWKTRAWIGRLVAPRGQRFPSAAEARKALQIRDRPPPEQTALRVFAKYLSIPLLLLSSSSSPRAVAAGMAMHLRRRSISPSPAPTRSSGPIPVNREVRPVRCPPMLMSLTFISPLRVRVYRIGRRSFWACPSFKREKRPPAVTTNTPSTPSSPTARESGASRESVPSGFKLAPPHSSSFRS
jgi:serine/threonine protein kinase